MKLSPEPSDLHRSAAAQQHGTSRPSNTYLRHPTARSIRRQCRATRHRQRPETHRNHSPAVTACRSQSLVPKVFPKQAPLSVAPAFQQLRHRAREPLGGRGNLSSGVLVCAKERVSIELPSGMNSKALTIIFILGAPRKARGRVQRAGSKTGCKNSPARLNNRGVQRYLGLWGRCIWRGPAGKKLRAQTLTFLALSTCDFSAPPLATTPRCWRATAAKKSQPTARGKEAGDRGRDTQHTTNGFALGNSQHICRDASLCPL